MIPQTDLPLAGLTVIELTHMVMGPSAGLVLADLGANVIRVEPVGGDHTRKLVGSGAGYFPMYNRNKRSICVNLKSESGKALVRKLLSGADILIENFRPGAMARLGLDYEALKTDFPRLIYCSAKGFLNGPYSHRTALDEVAQMMGGLAYMTGPPGRPLRAGSSVIDVMGGMFGVIGILAAVERRHRTGEGGEVTCSLYETTAFLVGQHMAQKAVTGKAAQPMPARISAWAIYDVFDTRDGEKLFVGVVSDAQWTAFCQAFALDELGADAALATNAGRVAARDTLKPAVQDLFLTYSKADLMAKLEKTGLPFAPITQPEDLFEDPHLTQSDGLVALTLPSGEGADLPALPVSIEGERLGVFHDLKTPGADTKDLLSEMGFSAEEQHALIEDGIVGADC